MQTLPEADCGTKIMLKPRKVVASLSLMSLLCVWFATAQDVAHVKPAQTDLDLVTIGNGKTKSGHPTALRIYAAPDGSKGQIVYAEFDSLQAARQQTEEWIKPISGVTSRERDQSKDDQLISDRILAVVNLPKSDKKEVVIIRRDGLNCYLIESVSLQGCNANRRLD